MTLFESQQEPLGTASPTPSTQDAEPGGQRLAGLRWSPEPQPSLEIKKGTGGTRAHPEGLSQAPSPA